MLALFTARAFLPSYLWVVQYLSCGLKNSPALPYCNRPDDDDTYRKTDRSGAPPPGALRSAVRKESSLRTDQRVRHLQAPEYRHGDVATHFGRPAARFLPLLHGEDGRPSGKFDTSVNHFPHSAGRFRSRTAYLCLSKINPLIFNSL